MRPQRSEMTLSSMEAPRKPRLIFHIGAGKTGTSSIQSTLKKYTKELNASGVWYLGLMFEHSPAKLFDWQRFGGHDEFLSLPLAQAEREFRRVLQVTIRRAAAAKIKTLIWSSESFFDRFDSVLKPLSEMGGNGVDLEVLAYVRRHDLWARSAYIQWGLKHKTYPGKIRTFSEWAANRAIAFGPTLRRYGEALPGRLRVRNYDTVPNVVDDFLEFSDLAHLGLREVRDNSSPSDTEILFRTIYNDTLPREAFPMQFSEKFGPYLESRETPNSFLDRLLPTADDLSSLIRNTSDDRSFLNALLVSQQQAPLEEGIPQARPAAVKADNLLFGLTQLALSQAKRIDALEHRMRMNRERGPEPSELALQSLPSRA